KKSLYQYNTTSSNLEELLSPVLDITPTGSVPRHLSNFNVYFPCISASSELESINCSITFRFYNITHNYSSQSIVNLKFLKQCVKNEKLNQSILSQFYNTAQIEAYLLTQSHRSLSSIGVVTILGYSIIIALIVFVLVFSTAMILFCLYRKTTRKKRHLLKAQNADTTHDLDSIPFHHQQHPQLPAIFDTTNCSAYEDSIYSFTQYDSQYKPSDETIHEALNDFKIEQNRVTLHEILIEGTFGRLIHCTYIDNKTISQNVYGKTVNSNASQTQINMMLNECCLFKSVKHVNINSPLGIVHMNELTPYPLILYPYGGKGILKRFLLKCKGSSSDGRDHMLSTQELVYMSIHVAKGLHFLHRRKLLMKDIAARNCM
ncbi:unnamed protein product, partial [Didymodactylos carnosus]